MFNIDIQRIYFHVKSDKWDGEKLLGSIKYVVTVDFGLLYT